MGLAQSTTSNIEDDISCSSSLSPEVHSLLTHVRKSVVGVGETFATPFGEQRAITYCDYIASGKSLTFIEDFIKENVLPLYANTHTTTSITGLQTGKFREQARQEIMEAINAKGDDVLVFCGSGSTAATNKLAARLAYFKRAAGKKVAVVVGPYEHHSNILPWREVADEVIMTNEQADGNVDLQHLEQILKGLNEKYQPKTNNDVILIGSFSAASNVTGVVTQKQNEITELLHRYGAFAFWDFACAAPYITIDMNPQVPGAVNAAAYHKDAIFISPHKLIGGPETPGILVAKRVLFMLDKIESNVFLGSRSTIPNHIHFGDIKPSNPGGGTVAFVTRTSHLYLENVEELEEAGTPAIIGSIRCGLVFKLKKTIGDNNIQLIETKLFQQAVSRWKKNPNIVLMGPINIKTVERLPICSFLIKHRQGFLHYNFVSALLNDLFGIQTRGGCSCAGPYGVSLLGISDYENELADAMKKTERMLLLKPGYSRLSFNYFYHPATIQFIIDAIDFVATHGWKFLPLYDVRGTEWKHMNNETMQGVIDLRKVKITPEGKLELPVQRKIYGQEKIEQSFQQKYKKYLERAHVLLEQTLSKYKDPSFETPSNGKELENLGFLTPYRWFPFPHEVLAELRGEKPEEAYKLIPDPVIVNPKKYPFESNAQKTYCFVRQEPVAQGQESTAATNSTCNLLSGETKIVSLDAVGGKVESCMKK